MKMFAVPSPSRKFRPSTVLLMIALPVAGVSIALTAQAQMSQAQTAPSSEPAGAPSTLPGGREMSPAMMRALAAQQAAARSGGGSGAAGSATSLPATTKPNFATSLPARPPGYTRHATPSLPREYAVLNERSLFKKGRIRTAEEVAADAANYRMPSPLSMLALTGVADATAEGSGGVQTVFIENTSSGSVQRLKAGDAVAGGKILSITLDSLEFEHDGKKAKISVGQTLDGQWPAGNTATTSLENTPSSSGVTYAPGSVAERMRLARLKAMGQAPGAPGATPPGATPGATPGAPGSAPGSGPGSTPPAPGSPPGSPSGDTPPAEPLVVPIPVPAPTPDQPPQTPPGPPPP